MAGKGTDWESWVTTKDLSIGRTQTPRAHPGSCWVMARWVGWTTARKQDRMNSKKESVKRKFYRQYRYEKDLGCLQVVAERTATN